jgi:uncharacterized protein
MYQPDELPRRPFLGFELRARKNADDARRGLEVVRVMPEGAAARAGIRPLDWIESVNDQEVSDARALVAYVRTLESGAPLKFVVDRQGDQHILNGQTIALPVENLAHANVHLAHVNLAHVNLPQHRQRILLTTPTNVEPPYPTILYLQGLSTQSCELSSDPDEPLRHLLEGFSQAGFATLRVEPSGLGDSEGPAFSTTNLFDDVAAYRAALDFLTHHPLVGKIFLFGHSVGGMIAPILVGEGSHIQGVVVFGTSVLRWVDCLVRATRQQKSLAGMKGEELDEYVALWEQMHKEVCRGGSFPEQVFERFPYLRWLEGSACRGETMFGRHATFFQQLERLNLEQLWKTVSTPVLVLHGEFDWACSPDEGEALARAIADVDPERVSFVQLSSVGHDMRRHTTIETSYANPREGHWDERIATTAIDWVQNHLK